MEKELLNTFDKELLLKDLCARLNTNLVCSIYREDDYGIGYRDENLHGYYKVDDGYEFYFGEDCGISVDSISKIKPYLFPLSSMTEEQHNEFFSYFHNIEMAEVKASGDYLKAAYIGDDAKYSWLNKNHFDYRYLIEKGLAIDATGLNIY